MNNICQSIRQMADNNPHFHFIYPVHLNQNVQKPVQHYLTHLPNVQLLSPLDYHTFVNLMSKADIILTDSGGVQEEGPSLGKPVLVLRNETERPEAVEAGTVKIVGTDRETIMSETLHLLNNPDAYQQMAQAQNPYGDGLASIRIADLLIEKL